MENSNEENKPNFNFDKFNIGANEILSEIENLNAKCEEPYIKKGLFTKKTANEWIEEAKKRPIPKMLFGEFWFEGELCILFADTNLGKSILAVQIANSISKSQKIEGFKLEAEKQQILYFDFEMTDKQFEARYSSDFGNHYIFDDNFKRLEINPDSDIPQYKTFEEFLNESLEENVKETKAQILIIDNITYLSTETEKAKDALPLMKLLKNLKNKYELSILALAHTPKRDSSKPISRNDLQGSKMLINFCDSAFAIGESQTDNAIRYFKQIKQRNTECVYDSENICLCQISKPVNFLQFELLTYGREAEHLRPKTTQDKQDIINKVKELDENGLKQREIAEQLGISLGAVNKYLKK